VSTRLVNRVADAANPAASARWWAAAHTTLVARLLDLGATPVDIGQGEVSWTVLADPEGNKLCVLSPR
jgi:hypothetical protein